MSDFSASPNTVPDPETQPTLSVQEAARFLGVSKRHLYRQLETESPPIESIQIGGVIRIPTAAFRAVLGLPPFPGTASLRDAA
ncbi:MAG: helix-turn-helix domain-containing protein [Ilumatobacter sp.]